MTVTDEMVRAAKSRAVQLSWDLPYPLIEQMLTAALAAMWRDAQPMEIRRVSDEVDEIVANNCSLHIERMSNDGWFIGVDSFDGSYHQFWLGAKNIKSHVEVRHTESTLPAPPATEVE